MSKFHYKATKNGEEYENTVDMPDRFAVYRSIRKEGGTVISVEKEDKKLPGKINFINNLLGVVKINDKIMFTRNLAVMIKAGLSLSRALSVLERQSKNKKFKKIIGKINTDIKKGSNLHDALSKFPKVFSPLFISMIKAGEESGGLSDALGVIGKQMELAHNLKKKIRGALIYPSIIVIAMFIIGAIMLVYVVPTLTQTFEELGVELPTSTQFVISISKFLTDNTIAAVILIIFLGLAAFAGFRSKKGRRMFEFILLRTPIVSGLVRQTNSARTTRTLSSLLSSGVEIVNALSITGEVIQNSYYKKILKQSEKNIQKGLPLSKVFMENEKFYPVLVGEMIAVGEETGKLSDMLFQTAEFYEDEIEQKTKNMSTIIEPFLMILIGAVVGFFAISMISPIYSISSGIS
ncbi:MAG: type II secretion system F family protein [Candidatus Pacebacteria bacterium]|jgi:type IV pilus assembly protein PilC|nr:type II secretion system F family protein [Candidatus Paceibacterota bacterium]|tara:strand:+ start:3277 stop:4494 length:1218 start_codon:yes stop_codon:yes gene_type:complete